MANKKIGLGILLFGLVLGMSFGQAFSYKVEITNNTPCTIRNIIGGDANNKGFYIKEDSDRDLSPKGTATYSVTDNRSLVRFVVKAFFTLGVFEEFNFPVKIESPKTGAVYKFAFNGTNNKNLSLVLTGTDQEAPRTGREIPQSVLNITNNFSLKNGLSGETITAVYVKAAGASDWGNNLLPAGTTIKSGTNYLNINPSVNAQNNANRFDIRVNTDKGKAYTLSNVAVSKGGEVTIR